MMVHRRKASWQQIFQNQTASGYQQHMQRLDPVPEASKFPRSVGYIASLAKSTKSLQSERRNASNRALYDETRKPRDALSGVLIDEPEGWIAREVFGSDLRDDVNLMLSPTRDL
jgi:hypothetical protein